MSVCDTTVGIQGLDLKQLRNVAKTYGIVGYSRMNKETLCKEIKKKGDEKLRYWMQDVCIREAVMKSQIGQEFINKCTKEGRARGELRYMPYFNEEKCLVSFSYQFFLFVRSHHVAIRHLAQRLQDFTLDMKYLYADPGAEDNLKVEAWNVRIMHTKKAKEFFSKYLGKSAYEALKDGMIYVFRNGSEKFRKEFFEAYYNMPNLEGWEALNPWNCYPQLKDYPFEARVYEHPEKPATFFGPDWKQILKRWEEEKEEAKEQFYSARSHFSPTPNASPVEKKKRKLSNKSK